MRPVSSSPPGTLRTRTLNKRVARPTPSRPTQAPTNDASVAQLCVDEINRYRATLGQRALERASDREGCADGQIKDDAHSGNWHGRFGACGESAQNECNSSPTAQGDFIKGCLRGMWNEGPGGGHYENMKSASATKVWCGFYTAPGGEVWSVQDFR
jgi:erythromycin esterase-like protein